MLKKPKSILTQIQKGLKNPQKNNPNNSPVFFNFRFFLLFGMLSLLIRFVKKNSCWNSDNKGISPTHVRSLIVISYISYKLLERTVCSIKCIEPGTGQGATKPLTESLRGEITKENDSIIFFSWTGYLFCTYHCIIIPHDVF